jgi:oxygen-independent coproporphyrinogen-3 oxidase
MSPHTSSLIAAYDAGLVNKYDVAGPRYTSYPTAPHFTTAFTIAQYENLWRRAQPCITPLSLYVHVPFCENICYYCACNKIVTRQKEKARQYLNYLEKEIRLQAQLVGATRPITQLHWGGGTPTFLNGAELTELMYALASHFTLLDSDDREYSIEIDPRTVDRNKLALLKGLGFNRISFGIQDFDPDVQRAVNRIQSVDSVRELVDAARGFGFKSISFDLIYGLPLQSLQSIAATLQQVIALKPDRLAIYSYAHLPERFPTQRSIDRMTLPKADEKIAMLQLANDRLGAAGYCHIGMDHFVLAHDELALAQQRGQLQRNFQGYSTCKAPDLVGLGVSSIGSTPLSYTQNARDLNDYYALLDRDVLPIERGLIVTDDDLIRRHVIMQIICNLQLDIAACEKQFAINWAQYFADEQAALMQLLKDGLIELDRNHLRVTRIGRMFLRNICMAFDVYLREARPTRFSRAI